MGFPFASEKFVNFLSPHELNGALTETVATLVQLELVKGEGWYYSAVH